MQYCMDMSIPSSNPLIQSVVNVSFARPIQRLLAGLCTAYTDTVVPNGGIKPTKIQEGCHHHLTALYVLTDRFVSYAMQYYFLLASLSHTHIPLFFLLLHHYYYCHPPCLNYYYYHCSGHYCIALYRLPGWFGGRLFFGRVAGAGSCSDDRFEKCAAARCLHSTVLYTTL